MASAGLTAAEIKNLALFTLGFPDEIDFTVLTNPTVMKVNRIYDTSLMYVLSNYPWRFVLKRATLASAPSTGEKYAYQYNLPADLLAIRCPYSDSKYYTAIREYDSTPDYIYTDSSTCYLWYIAEVDEEDFPHYFVDYFKYKLALDLCFNMTGDTDLLQILAKQEERMLISAKNIDAKQVGIRTIKSSPFTQIRG